MSQEPKKMERRTFIYAGLGAAAVILAGSTIYFATKPAETTTSTSTATTTATSTATSTTTATTTTTATSTPLGKPYAGTKITYCTLLFAPTQAYQKLISDFTDATGIEVEFVLLTELEMYAKQLLDLSTGAASFDVMSSHHWDLARYARAGWLAPLEQFYTNPDLTKYGPYPFDLNDFFGAQLGVLKYNWPTDKKDHLFGIPWMSSITTMMYNKELFAKYGVAEPPLTETQQFWSLDQLEAAAAKLNHPEDGIIGVALRGQNSWALSTYSWTSFFRALGGEYVDKNWNPTVNSDIGVKSLVQYARILQNSGPPGAATWTWEEAEVSMAQGKVAIICDASNLASRISDPTTSKVIGKIVFAPYPGGWPGLSQWSSFISALVPKKRQEAAWLFMQWMNSKEIVLRGALLGLVPEPPLKSLYTNPTYIMASKAFGGMSFINNELSVQDLAYKNSLLSGRCKDFMPVISEMAEIGDALAIAISDTIAGKYGTPPETAQVKAALDGVAASWKKTFTDAGYYKSGVAPPPFNP